MWSLENAQNTDWQFLFVFFFEKPQNHFWVEVSLKRQWWKPKQLLTLLTNTLGARKHKHIVWLWIKSHSNIWILLPLFPSHRSVERVKRNAAKPSDILRLLKQPVGVTRAAVRAVDYMDNTVKLIRASLFRRQKRSINATGALGQNLLRTYFFLSPPHFVSSFTLTNEFFSLHFCHSRPDLWGRPAPHCHADWLLCATALPLMQGHRKHGQIPHFKRCVQQQVRRQQSDKTCIFETISHTTSSDK